MKPAPPPRMTNTAPPSGHSVQGPGNSAAPSNMKPVDTIMATPRTGSTGAANRGVVKRATASASNPPAVSSHMRDHVE